MNPFAPYFIDGSPEAPQELDGMKRDGVIICRVTFGSRTVEQNGEQVTTKL